MLYRSTLIRPAFVLLGAALAAAAVPAGATPRHTRGGEETSDQTAQSTEKKICLSPTVTGQPIVTGSVLPHRECRTKAEWEARGVEFKTK